MCSCSSGFTLSIDGHSCASCGSVLTGSSGSFQTPGWPNSYAQMNFKCEWIIQLPDTRALINFTIDDSAYGIAGPSYCPTDYIQFYDGVSSDAVSLHKLCRFDNPGSFCTNTSLARVVFAGSDQFRLQSRVGVRVFYNTTGKLTYCKQASRLGALVCGQTDYFVYVVAIEKLVCVCITNVYRDMYREIW